MIEKTPIDKLIGQMTFSFMEESGQMWFPWFEEKIIEPKPRKRTKPRKKKKDKND
tara:strand:- start:168 stop:332 length:165 start_codon:yes stop_codon:yes gene_type:complete